MAETETLTRPTRADHAPDALLAGDGVRDLVIEARDIAREMIAELSADGLHEGEALALLHSLPQFNPALPLPPAAVPGLVGQMRFVLQSIRSASGSASAIAKRALAIEHQLVEEQAAERREAQEQAVIRSEQRAAEVARENETERRAAVQARREAAAREEAAEQESRGLFGRVRDSQVVAVVGDTARRMRGKASTALGATTLMMSSDRDARRVGLDILHAGVERNFGEGAADAVYAVGDTTIAARTGAETGLGGALRVVTLQGREEDATAFARGVSRRLQLTGMNEDQAEAVGHQVGDVLRTGARMSDRTGEAVDRTRAQAEAAARAAAAEAARRGRAAGRAADDARDAAADRLAAMGRMGQGLAGVRQMIQNDPGLRAIFDTDRDGKAELHEIRDTLKNSYGVRNMDQLDRDNNDRITLADVRAVVRRPVPPRN